MIAERLLQPCDENCRVRSGHDMACTGACGRKPCGKCGGTGNELYGMFRCCGQCGGSGHHATIASGK